MREGVALTRVIQRKPVIEIVPGDEPCLRELLICSKTSKAPDGERDGRITIPLRASYDPNRAYQRLRREYVLINRRPVAGLRREPETVVAVPAWAHDAGGRSVVTEPVIRAVPIKVRMLEAGIPEIRRPGFDRDIGAR